MQEENEEEAVAIPDDEGDQTPSLSVDEADALERIAKDDPDQIIQPSAVVEAASDPASPLHQHFEWDDAVAGHAHRLAQARRLIVRYTIRVVEKETVTVKADVQVVEQPRAPQYVNAVVNGRRGYVSLERAANDPDLYRQIAADARRGIAAYRNRLAAFEGARPVVEALDEAVNQIDLQEKEERAA